MIFIIFFQIDIPIFSRLWRHDRTELAILVLTFLVSIFRTVELAVAIGVMASLAVLLSGVMRPKVTMASIKVCL